MELISRMKTLQILIYLIMFSTGFYFTHNSVSFTHQAIALDISKAFGMQQGL